MSHVVISCSDICSAAAVQDSREMRSEQRPQTIAEITSMNTDEAMNQMTHSLLVGSTCVALTHMVVAWKRDTARWTNVSRQVASLLTDSFYLPAQWTHVIVSYTGMIRILRSTGHLTGLSQAVFRLGANGERIN